MSDACTAALIDDDTDMTSPSLLSPKVLVSDEIRVIIQWIVYAVLLTIISGLGVCSNIINIVCFVRQGLKDPVNISLLGLAISDLCSLLTTLCMGIGTNPAIHNINTSVDLMDVLYIASAWPHVIFTETTSWLTALITLERCLCITMPLKVKRIITPRRVTVIVMCLFILFTCSVSPMYYVSSLIWVFAPERNKTVLRLEYTDNRAIVEQVSYGLNNALIPFAAYFMIIFCTFTLVVQLRKKAKWRMKSATSANVNSASDRDQRVAKMVIMISTLFIVCFSPLCLAFISMFAVPDLAVDGPNQNFLYVIGGLGLLLEATNSSANIFIYYHMSSRYKIIFREIFGCGKTKEIPKCAS